MHEGACLLRGSRGVEHAREGKHVGVVLGGAVEVRVRGETRGESLEFVIARGCGAQLKQNVSGDRRVAFLAACCSKVGECHPNPCVVSSVDGPVGNTCPLVGSGPSGGVRVRCSKKQQLPLRSGGIRIAQLASAVCGRWIEQLDEGIEHMASLFKFPPLGQVDRGERIIIDVVPAVWRLLVVWAWLDEFTFLVSARASANRVWAKGLHEASRVLEKGLPWLIQQKRINCAEALVLLA
mmetsp:Transcript_18921/g.40767  ORF Transcript_18921/g.40767 Transcript_18921/m.40767 type:complete len:237 (-) Transcript_18921:280-990(-)